MGLQLEENCDNVLLPCRLDANMQGRLVDKGPCGPLEVAVQAIQACQSSREARIAQPDAVPSRSGPRKFMKKVWRRG